VKSVRRKIKAPTGLRPGELRSEAQREAQASLTGWWYAGCPGCGRRMTTSDNTKVCQDCSTLGPYGRPLWDRESDPKTCCFLYCAPITDPRVLQNYRCGGDTPWWLCSGCRRTHPYDPTDETRGGKA